MATNFPGALDTTAELPNDRDNNTLSHDSHPQDHNNLADAVLAVEAELGANPSGPASTVGARIAAAESSVATEASARAAADAAHAALTASGNDAHGAKTYADGAIAAAISGLVVTESDPVATAALASHVAASDPHAQYQKESEKGQANGYAGLDGSGQVPLSQLGNAPAPDLSAYATDSELAAHETDTTAVHGIADTAALVLTSDARLSDTRTPSDGSVTDAKIASTLSPSKVTGTAVVTADSRLSDARTPTDASVTAAKVAPSLKPSGTAVSTDEALRALGTTAATAAAGNDSRLSNARTPTAHAASHGSGGSDPITLAESQVTGLVTDLAAKAPLASPAFTGTPTVPDQTTGDNSGNAANTKFVQTASGLLIPKSLVTAKGDLIAATGSGAVARKAVGSDGQALVADSSDASGLAYDLAARAFPFKTGLYYSPHFIGFSAGNPGTGTVTYIPIAIGQKQAFDRIACFVNASGASSVIRLGIFNDDGNGQPGTLIVDAGTVDASTTGAKEIVIAQTLKRGIYWLGVCVQVATSSPLLANSNVLNGNLLSWAAPVNGGSGAYRQTGVAGAFANATGFVTISGSNPIVAWLRAA